MFLMSWWSDVVNMEDDIGNVMKFSTILTPVLKLTTHMFRDRKKYNLITSHSYTLNNNGIQFWYLFVWNTINKIHGSVYALSYEQPIWVSFPKISTEKKQKRSVSEATLKMFVTY